MSAPVATSAHPAAAPAGPSAAVKTVGVVGAGTMGNGIAQTFATAGFDVELVDVKPEFVERALATIGKNLDRVAKKQEWPADRAPGVLRRIKGGVNLEAAGGCQLVVGICDAGGAGSCSGSPLLWCFYEPA